MSLGSRALALSVRLFWPLMFVSMALFQSYVVFEVCLASWKGLGVFLYPILGTVFVLVIAHLLLSYILTALTDPGKAPLASWVVPSGESLARLESDATLFDHLTRSDADKNRAALERIKESLVPPEYLVFYCEFCRAPKPPRTHHCSRCDRCVLRMDHHCFWIGGCVGFRNHKAFLCLLMSVLLSGLFCAVVIATRWTQIAFRAYTDQDTGDHDQTAATTTQIILLSVSTAIALFHLLFAIWLNSSFFFFPSRGMTYVEYLCCRGRNWACHYDKGSARANLEDFLGPHVALWFLPFDVRFRTNLDGCLYFPTLDPRQLPGQE